MFDIPEVTVPNLGEKRKTKKNQVRSICPSSLQEIIQED